MVPLLSASIIWKIRSAAFEAALEAAETETEAELEKAELEAAFAAASAAATAPKSLIPIGRLEKKMV